MNMVDALFAYIDAEFSKRDREMLRAGKLPMRSTEKGFWHAAIAKEVFEAFKALNLGSCGRFLDLGSGDGRVVLIASLFAKEAHGVESDLQLHKTAEEMKKSLGIANAKFHLGDFYTHDLSEYDVLFINPDTPFSRGLETKLLKEMRGEIIVVGSHFLPASLTLKKKIEVRGTLFSSYSK